VKQQLYDQPKGQQEAQLSLRDCAPEAHYTDTIDRLHDFIFTFCSNSGARLYRFWDIAW